MPRASKPKPGTTTPPAFTPSKTSHLFATRKVAAKGPITRETIAADLEAFHQSGGKIEVLGTTRSLQHIGLPAEAEPAPVVAPAAGRARKSTR